MSRTRRLCRHPHRRECKDVRVAHHRRYRAQVRQALHRGWWTDWQMPRWRRTCGWLTW